MRKVKVIIFMEDGEISRESLDLKGFLLNPLVLQGFNFELPPVGKVNSLWWKEDKLFAEIELTPGYEGLISFYPAIGYRMQGNKYELITIGLCLQPNVDPRIKTIQNQVLEKEIGQD